MLVDRHPAGGYFELATDGLQVALRCHWPVDLDDDEWVDIRNLYSLSSYVQAVRTAMRTGSGELPGIAGGFLRIRSLAAGFQIEFSRPQTGWCASSLQLYVRRPVGELMLQEGPI